MTKTTLLKLAVIVSTIFFLASCAFKYHVHTMTKIEAKASTCTETGNIEYYRCTQCGDTFIDKNGHKHVENVDTAPAGHSLVKQDAKFSTLDAEGYEAYWKCSVCGIMFKDDAGTQETTLDALTVPKGFAKLNEGTVTVSTGDANGPFKNASSTPVPVNEFYMAKTETTYERWYEVYTWATASERGTQQYTFANKGREGNDGTDGADPTEARQEPVTSISWRDAVVWCNAASEMDGKTPVYYLTTTFTSDNVLRTSESQTDAAAGSGKAEKAVINKDADGYRLPTEAEWEYAARGGNPNSTEWSYTYAGTNSDSDLGDYAVTKENSGSKTADVGKKNKNSVGLYDMSGNVWEWCQDMYASGSAVCVYRGGSWYNNSSYATVAYRNGLNPFTQYNNIGFRVCF